MIDKAELCTYVLIAFLLGFIAGFIDSDMLSYYIKKRNKHD